MNELISKFPATETSSSHTPCHTWAATSSQVTTGWTGYRACKRGSHDAAINIRPRLTTSIRRTVWNQQPTSSSSFCHRPWQLDARP